MNDSAHSVIRLFQQDMEQAHPYAFLGGQTQVYSRRAPEKETPNEDACALIPYDAQNGVLVVCDGMGGLPNGQDASRLAIDCLKQAVDDARSQNYTLREAILDGIEKANRQVQDKVPGAGTTCAVIELAGRTVRSYHVGDSLILVTGQRGKVKYQTVAHSPVGYAVEAGVLHHDDAMHHEDRHLISNMIGSPEMRIEIGHPLNLAERDTLVVASDGLSDNLYQDEIVELVRRGPLAKSAQKVADQARARMQQPREGTPSHADDLTFILFRPR